MFKVFNPNNETMQSSVDVNIEIEDVNDNSPTFDMSVYNVSINETVKDQVILQLLFPTFLSVHLFDDLRLKICNK